MSLALGLDTSNYTTSTALYNSDTRQVIQQKKLLPVAKGQLGLRQSDAVFHHVQQLPEMMTALFAEGGAQPEVIGVSTKPRPVEGSYMPCFEVGRGAAEQLAAWGVKEVLITLGSLGSLIYAEGKLHRIPAYPPKDVVDATGCGDTYAAGYLYKRNQGASFYESGCFAAAMSTLKLEQSGPFCGTEEDIMAIIQG